MRSRHVVAIFLVAGFALMTLGMTKFRPNYQPSVHPQVRLRSGRLAAVPRAVFATFESAETAERVCAYFGSRAAGFTARCIQL